MRFDEAWPLPPERLPLQEHEVHVWRADLDVSLECLRVLRALLSEEERQRANRLVRLEDQCRSVASRGILRTLLGQYLGREPEGLRFVAGKHGKPSLAADAAADLPGKSVEVRAKAFPGRSSLHFNLSHSGKLLLIGVAAGLDIGIDVELVRPMRHAERLVQRFFSEREQAEFRSVPEALRREAFFTCWSRKEAFLKALGRGLSHPLNRFSVSVHPGEPIRFRCEKPGGGVAPELWSFLEIRPGQGYVAAAVVGGRPRGLHCWQWVPSWSGLSR